jgi:hypothetical protein
VSIGYFWGVGAIAFSIVVIGPLSAAPPTLALLKMLLPA